MKSRYYGRSCNRDYRCAALYLSLIVFSLAALSTVAQVSNARPTVGSSKAKELYVAMGRMLHETYQTWTRAPVSDTPVIDTMALAEDGSGTGLQLHRQLDGEADSSLSDEHGVLHAGIYALDEVHGNHKNGHGHTDDWKVLAEVDGLRNEDVALFLLGTNKDGGIYLRDRIIPSARTWMRLLKNVFVVLEDTFEVRFSMRQCHLEEYDRFTTFECPQEPTYILSRECTSEYFGGNGPCCKVDEMFIFLTQSRPDLYSRLKFILHGDDDQFWRMDQILRWLAAVDKAGLDDFPLVGQGATTPCNKGAYGIKRCHEMNTIGWYQPLFMNKAALQRIAPTADQYGSKQQCNVFRMTHDVGLGPYFWMFGMIHISIPGFGHQIDSKHFNENFVVTHGIKHKADVERCGDGQDWASSLRYNQQMAIGCGDLRHPNPNRDKAKSADHYEAWLYYKDHGRDLQFGVKDKSDWVEVRAILYPPDEVPEGKTIRIKKILDAAGVITADGYDQHKQNAGKDVGEYEGEKVVDVVIPKLYPLYGYDTTKHSKEHSIREKFVPFTLRDCDPPGDYGND